MLLSFATGIIIRLRPKWVRDDRNNLVEGEMEALQITGCSIQPGASAEDVAMRQTTTIDYTIFAPATTDVCSTDRLEIYGEVYEVVGEPQRWNSPTGTISHVKILARRWSDKRGDA